MRTKGSRDHKKRKIRKDRVHKYVHRKGKLVPYISKRQRTDPIKLWLFQELPMNPDSIRHWHYKIRPKIRKIVFKPLIRVDADVSRICNKESIENLFLDVLGYEGDFTLKTFSHAKNRFRVKPITIAKVKIRDSPTGLKASATSLWRISRYWFWSK